MTTKQRKQKQQQELQRNRGELADDGRTLVSHFSWNQAKVRTSWLVRIEPGVFQVLSAYVGICRQCRQECRLNVGRMSAMSALSAMSARMSAKCRQKWLRGPPNGSIICDTEIPLSHFGFCRHFVAICRICRICRLCRQECRHMSAYVGICRRKMLAVTPGTPQVPVRASQLVPTLA